MKRSEMTSEFLCDQTNLLDRVVGNLCALVEKMPHDELADAADRMVAADLATHIESLQEILAKVSATLAVAK
jgi:hypothetical protein